MSGTKFQPAWLNDLRLAAHALSPTPVWLWSADASKGDGKRLVVQAEVLAAALLELERQCAEADAARV